MINKKHLSNSEVKEINEQIKNLYKIENAIEKKDVAILEEDIIRINNKSSFFYYNIDNTKNNNTNNIIKIIIPTLRNILESKIWYETLKKVTVDMGAVKFVVSGADVMRPGIVAFDDEINKDDIILVVDVNHKKPLAVGIMQFAREEAKAMSSGKIVKNVHWVGDKVWNS